jgi:hypothetical protein
MEDAERVPKFLQCRVHDLPVERVDLLPGQLEGSSDDLVGELAVALG